MEVWALEAYGAAYTLQEILTYKSDDTVGRVRTYDAIINGQPIPKPGVPESFRVLVKELQALGLDMKVLDGHHQEVQLKNMDEDDSEVVSVDALAKYAEQHNTSNDKKKDSASKTTSASTTEDKTKQD